MKRKVTPANVRRLARRREPENWELRDRLREPGIDRRELDALVHRLYREAAAEFDCKSCANCCKETSPMLDAEDVGRLAEGLGVTAESLIDEHLKWDDAYGGFVFKKMPCPFLKHNLCSCYPCRPQDCASYPHLHKDGFARRLANTVANCPVCPIVYTVYERLKIEMR